MDQGNLKEIDNDEITLKELVLIFKEYSNEILASWKLIAIIGVLTASLFLWRAATKSEKYTARLTFMINEDQGGQGGGISSILGTFGFGGGGGEYNLEKIIELTRSRNIIQKALFTKNQQSEFLANQIIDVYDFHEKWDEDTTGMKNFSFAHGNFSDFSKLENKALLSVYNKVIGNSSEGIEGLLEIFYQEETSILNMSISSQKETLSIDLLKSIYDFLSDFYIEKRTEKPLHTYQTLKIKVDSIKAVLDQTEYALAREVDTGRGLMSEASKINKERLKRNVQMLSIAYGKALENLEIADFSLKNAMPFFQVIDTPLSPIKPFRESKVKAIIIGAFLGGLLLVLFVILRKIYRDAVK